MSSRPDRLSAGWSALGFGGALSTGSPACRCQSARRLLHPSCRGAIRSVAPRRSGRSTLLRAGQGSRSFRSTRRSPITTVATFNRPPPCLGHATRSSTVTSGEATRIVPVGVFTTSTERRATLRSRANSSRTRSNDLFAHLHIGDDLERLGALMRRVVDFGGGEECRVIGMAEVLHGHRSTKWLAGKAPQISVLGRDQDIWGADSAGAGSRPPRLPAFKRSSWLPDPSARRGSLRRHQRSRSAGRPR